jgi:phenylacetate-CoA ligase
MLAERIRNWGFWASDFAHGSPIRNHCQDIEAQLSSDTRSAERLEAMLRYATAHTPFFSKHRDFACLQDFPIQNKASMKADYDAFRSDEFAGQALHIMHTSGSTGTPFEVPQNPEKRHRVLAEMICFGRRAGYEVGDRFVFTRVWTPVNRKRWHVALRENLIMFDITSLDDSRMASLRDVFRRNPSIRCMQGFPSTFEALLRHMDKEGNGPEDIHLRAIISLAERLSPETRKALQARFGCTVVSRYSNQEIGVLAQQCPNADEYHLNTASCVFEFLKLEEDAPAVLGEPARVVVTDLFNRAMPMIRYDTGDVVIQQPSAICGWKTRTLRGIEGRRLDLIYDTRDRVVSPFVLCSAFWAFTKLKQYQFIQEAKGQYKVVLNGPREAYPDQTFIDLAKGFLGPDASVSVVHVDDIPLLASGKYMQVVSRYRPPA